MLREGLRAAIQLLRAEWGAWAGIIMSSTGNKLFLNGKLNRGFRTIYLIELHIAPLKGTGFVRRKSRLQNEKHTCVPDTRCIGLCNLPMEIEYSLCWQRFWLQCTSHQAGGRLLSRRRVIRKEAFKGIGSMVDADLHAKSPEFFSQAKIFIRLVAQHFVQLTQGGL